MAQQLGLTASSLSLAQPWDTETIFTSDFVEEEELSERYHDAVELSFQTCQNGNPQDTGHLYAGALITPPACRQVYSEIFMVVGDRASFLKR